LVAVVWIVVSGVFAASSSASVEELKRTETVKGVGYVLVTALALFAAARFVLRRFERSAREIVERERLLVANERRIFAGLIASSVAHDANNVLTAVLADLGMLEGQADAATLRRLHAALDRLVQLNRRVVNAARHSTSTALQPLDLSAAVRDAVNLVRSHPAVRRAKVTVTTTDRVPVVANLLLVSQIVTNLVVNAAEATAGEGAIGVRVDRDGAGALLTVDDDGPGIPQDRRAGIFEALTTTKPEGNGIGLFSVKASVAALGGKVTVESSPAGGASFRVTLPVAAN
jgi:signal transduction histidine kinase